MFSLNNFYTSKEWTGLMKIIKSERESEEGHIYCDLCGKPIMKPYDCIGHHTTPLTEQNVNDYDISLNKQLIQLLHHRCHNKVHNKLGYAQRQIYLVYGAPLSGKSTYVREAQGKGDLVIDMDNIWSCVSGLGRYEKPGRLNAVVFEVRNKLMECVKYRIGKWNNAYIIGGYPLISERERLCKELGAREIYIKATKEECMERLENCADGREKEEWEGYICKWFRSARI